MVTGCPIILDAKSNFYALVNNCLTLPTFIWDNKEGGRQITRLRLRPLSTYIMENRIRRASGPGHAPIPLHKLMGVSITGFMGGTA